MSKDFNTTKFIENLYENLISFLPDNLSNEDQQFLKRDTKDLLDKIFHYVYDNEFLNLSIEETKLYVSMFGEFSFCKEVDFMRSGLEKDVWVHIYNHIMENIIAYLDVAFVINLDINSKAEVIRNRIKRLYVSEIEQLYKRNIIAENNYEYIKSLSYYDEIFKQSNNDKDFKEEQNSFDYHLLAQRLCEKNICIIERKFGHEGLYCILKNIYDYAIYAGEQVSNYEDLTIDQKKLVVETVSLSVCCKMLDIVQVDLKEQYWKPIIKEIADKTLEFILLGIYNKKCEYAIKCISDVINNIYKLSIENLYRNNIIEKSLYENIVNLPYHRVLTIYKDCDNNFIVDMDFVDKLEYIEKNLLLAELEDLKKEDLVNIKEESFDYKSLANNLCQQAIKDLPSELNKTQCNYVIDYTRDNILKVGEIMTMDFFDNFTIKQKIFMVEVIAKCSFIKMIDLMYSNIEKQYWEDIILKNMFIAFEVLKQGIADNKTEQDIYATVNSQVEQCYKKEMENLYNKGILSKEAFKKI